MELNNQFVPVEYSQLKLEMDLTGVYLHQLCEEPVPLSDVHELYEAGKRDIGMLWASDEGRTALLPSLASRPNVSDQKLHERRTMAEKCLAVLFERFATIESVAEEQGVDRVQIRETLRTISGDWRSSEKAILSCSEIGLGLASSGHCAKNTFHIPQRS